jgi:hypothetical protein
MAQGFDCITDYTDKIDERINTLIKIDRKNGYGLVHKMYTDEKRQENIADVRNSIEDGRLAYWDDRYGMIWFHRLIRSRFSPDNSAYGRKSTGATEQIDIALVAWAKRKNSWLGNRIEIKQHKLYDYIAAILAGIEGVAIQSCNFEHAEIEAAEFTENRTNKESILLKFEYRIFASNRICTTIPDCSFDFCEFQ